MATLPRFIFPLPQDTTAFDCGFDLNIPPRAKSHIQLQTETSERGHSLTVPKRPEPLKTFPTPPNPPPRLRVSPMGVLNPRTQHNSDAITPPPTPTHPLHSKTNSGSGITESLCCLRRGDSTSSCTSRPRCDTHVDESERPGSTELRTFLYWSSDYDIQKDEKGKKISLGSGLWSDVYIAKPCLPSPKEQTPTTTAAGSHITPPITPSHSRNSSLSQTEMLRVPAAYAIKVPAMSSAKKVLDEEARVVSYLSRFPDFESHVVPFYGQDTRTHSLVMKAMDYSLEDWIDRDLNGLQEQTRMELLVKAFPIIAIQLIDGLTWMDAHKCVHADIKPANILLSTTELGSIPHVVYSDFSSAILITPTAVPDTQSKPRTPLGGGTWDYLDPALLNTSGPVSPSTQTDLWSVAITLLAVIIGSSPFDSANNKYQRREFVKQGTPFSFATYGDHGPRNLDRVTYLSQALGFDVQKWLRRVLNRDVSKRVNIRDWREELQYAMQTAGPKK